MGLWRKTRTLLQRDRDDDSRGKWSDAGDQMLDAKVAALGNNPAPPGYLPKPDDGRPATSKTTTGGEVSTTRRSGAWALNDVCS